MRSGIVLLASLLIPTFVWAADKPAVVELFEEDTEALIPQLTMGGITGGEKMGAAAEKDSVFTGAVALRVSPHQRFNPEIKDWDFQIAERPKAGEYRYLRFAWKKVGDGPIMLQICTKKPKRDWYIRYHAGPTPPPWEAKVLSQTTPTEWQVATCDLFKDFGNYSLGGIAFSPLEGSDGLFDHILLGRTIEDLDRATAAAISQRPQLNYHDGRLKQLWRDMESTDDMIGSTAMWAMFAGRDGVTPYLLKWITIPERKNPPPVDEAKANALIADLTHHRHLTRQVALDELHKLGDGVVPLLRKATAAADGEAKERLQLVLDRWTVKASSEELRLRRCVTILRAVDKPEAKDMLAKIEKALK
jgi:hypothetical protein